ncbi:MAG: DotU family type IV/VI secretion system protein [Gemmatimonadaceae bacterium]|jgi:type VI secretion system protein ImpK|nr:DotU family type IV/VI secretion system protein [Gemmatimonadaceae bacterium]
MTAAIPPVAHGRLALSLQELFTVIGRLRDGRVKPADTEAFRRRVKELVAAANDDGVVQGYSAKDVGLAVYAAVALLDESVLNSGLALSADWARKPLQDELFGEHRAGENYFAYIDRLMQRDDAPVLADLLEVYQLCLLLGFRGKYAPGAQGGPITGDAEALASIRRRLGDRIRRIRGEVPPLSTGWRPPSGETVAQARDPWVRRLLVVLLVVAALIGALFVITRLLLAGGIPS